MSEIYLLTTFPLSATIPGRPYNEKMSTSYKAVAAELVWNNVYQILTSAVIIAIAYVVKVVAGAQRPYKGVSLIGAADGLSKLKKRYIQDSAGMIRSGLNQVWISNLEEGERGGWFDR